MKIRSGFVSNSSSSSFIVTFDKEIKNEKELRELLFGDEKIIRMYGYEADAKKLAETIFWDMKGQEPFVVEKAEDLLPYIVGYFEDYPETDWNNDEKESRKIAEEYKEKHNRGIHNAPQNSSWRKRYEKVRDEEWKKTERRVDRARLKYAKKILPKFIGKKCYTFCYADEDGSFFCILEHGGTFDNIPHIQFSNH